MYYRYIFISITDIYIMYITVIYITDIYILCILPIYIYIYYRVGNDSFSLLQLNSSISVMEKFTSLKEGDQPVTSNNIYY